MALTRVLPTKSHMKYTLFLLAAGVMYVCCRFGAMAGWWASLSRRVRSLSTSSFHSGARVTEGRGTLVRPVVNSSRVAVLGSMIRDLVDEQWQKGRIRYSGEVEGRFLEHDLQCRDEAREV